MRKVRAKKGGDGWVSEQYLLGSVKERKGGRLLSMDSRRRGLGGRRDEGQGGCGESEEAEELHGRSSGQLNSKDTL